jgi:parallel beta-helix repeat protein
VTFSRNIISGNRIFECDHGIWGGYSYNTVIAGNQFRQNRIAIAIEHGQENEIHHNIFHENNEAIRLWANKQQPADWGYAKNRDTRSRDYAITNNNFNSNPIVMNIIRSEKLNVFDNIYDDMKHFSKSILLLLNSIPHITRKYIKSLVLIAAEFVPDIPSPQNAFTGNSALAGRENIMMTEWGPYDFRSPSFGM